MHTPADQAHPNSQSSIKSGQLQNKNWKHEKTSSHHFLNNPLLYVIL
jgi:hypothetical protein